MALRALGLCVRRAACARVPLPAAATVGRALAASFSATPAPPAPPQLPADKHEAKAYVLLVALGHRGAVVDAVLAALRDSRLSGEALLGAVRGLIGRPEVGHDGGLDALVASVEQQLAAEEGRARVRFRVLTPRARGWDVDERDPSRFEVEAFEGMSIADVARHGAGAGPGARVLSELLECACSGVMACSTCHVVVAPEWFARVGEPDEDERDMLDLAFEPTSTSRLGCQVVLRAELDGLVLRVPRGANNMMDNIPFPD
ncbi:hypothetical protein KFE25_011718 [Diacronema lutheri]|uniref:2Fe-2S ferredoxin-type domain-containing protein n=2 Tax=Diacronema lutheri TaxID=2081491 RepID=A0A8J5X879_DIALT|nr:hypothetical protein KFE25_011718 [Diacronema lutheri]